MDRYRDERSPGRDRSRYSRDPPPADIYVPPNGRATRPRSRSPAGYRRRSRTPPRWETDNWRGRPRSPPRRYDSTSDPYAREERPRSPRREYHPRDAPYDDDMRPTAHKRGREYSPRRSPAPAKRERLGSPRREYGRPRSRSPVRDARARSRSPRADERSHQYSAASWRRRSPSPRGSGRVSAATSRRSSPRPRQPEPYAAEPEAYERRHESDYPANGHGYDEREREAVAADAEYHGNGRNLAPPSGPAGTNRSSAMSPPSGPSSSTPVSMSAHNRPGGSSVLSAPSQPRGGYPARSGGPPPREYSRDYASRLHPRHGSSSHGAPSPVPYTRGPGSRESSYPPKDGYSYESRGPPRHRDGPPYNPPFRGSNNSTSTTYPRTQRFNQPLSDLPSVKAGGERRPDLYDTTKADRLDEEAAKLRKLIDEKEAKKRKGLQEWDKLEREATTASLRSNLSEEHLRQLNGEESSVAF